MDKQRQMVVDEINRMETAIKKTKSPYLRKDYEKSINYLKNELRDYDRFRKESV